MTPAGAVSTYVSSNLLDEPVGLAYNAGNLYIANAGNNTISKVTTTALNVTNASTFENTQTVLGLVIAPNAADVGTVTSFQITNITGGSLFLNDGVTPVTNGDFIAVAQGAAGLKFTPTTGSLANGSFTVEESTTGDASGLIAASKATATITVIAPVPTVTNAMTGEERASDGAGDHAGRGRRFADHEFPDHRNNGRLALPQRWRNAGCGRRVYYRGSRRAGLTFVPTTGSLATGSFTVQDSAAADVSGLLGYTATATITVLAPKLTIPSLLHGAETISWAGLGLDSAGDTADVTAYRRSRRFRSPPISRSSEAVAGIPPPFPMASTKSALPSKMRRAIPSVRQRRKSW